MLIFPKNRHGRNPVSYKVSIYTIIVAFLNLIAMPAYAQEIQYKRDEFEKTISEVFAPGLQSKPELEFQQKSEEKSGYLTDSVDEATSLLLSYQEDVNSANAFKDKRITNELSDIIERLNIEKDGLINEFVSDRKNLEGLHGDDVLIDRHNATVKKFQEQFANYINLLSELESTSINDAKYKEVLREAVDFSESIKSTSKHKAFDPAKMGYKAQNDEKIEKPLLITVGSEAVSKHALLKTKTNLPAFEPTEEMKVLAQQLDNDPVKIYNWVYNNIAFKPSYGAIQGNDITFISKSGNTVDTNIFLAGLLSAAGIDTKFSTGIVSLTNTQILNWIGVDDIDLATDILANSGIPTRVIVEAGEISRVELIHFWVEAFVDFIPSRGYQNNKPDTWIALDASFKAHKRISGIDKNTIPKLDSKAIYDKATSNASFSHNGLVVSDVDTNYIKTSVENHRAEAEAFLSTNNIDSVEKLLGGLKVIPREIRRIDATLPYHLVEKKSESKTVPEYLIHYIAVTIKDYVPLFGSNSMGSEVLTHKIALPEVGNKRLGVTYRMATAADQEWFDNNTSSSIPLYSLRVIPTLKLDDDVIAEGASVAMGGDQTYQLSLYDARGRTNSDIYDVIAGDEVVIGINGNGISKDVVIDRWNEVDPHNSAAENLHQVALHYWMEADMTSFSAANSNNSYFTRKPSVGLFLSPLTVSYQFGIPRKGTYASWGLDIAQSVVAFSSEKESDRLSAMQQSGIYSSYLESSVLEQLFSRVQGSGVSATQLLMDAARLNIPIYTITKDNVNSLISELQVDADVLTDIRRATSHGLVVTIPQTEISKGRWTGSGYSITDPVTGSGAYLISGGKNGSNSDKCDGDSKPEPNPLHYVLGALLLLLLLLLLWWLLPIIGGWLIGGAAIGGGISVAYAGESCDPCKKVKLYRAIDDTERSIIQHEGVFTIGGSSLMAKQFWENYDSAVCYGNKWYIPKKQPYNVIKVTVSEASKCQMEDLGINLDNCGQAWSADYLMLNFFNADMLRFGGIDIIRRCEPPSGC